MPLLVYCVLLQDVTTELPNHGVRNAEVHAVRTGRLIALYSEMEQSSIAADSFKDSALEFHHVVHSVFARSAVIPFRFPTWLSKAELIAHLEDKSVRYESFLRDHAAHVQMELRVEQTHAGVSHAASGTEHLRARAAQLGELEKKTSELKRVLAPQVLEWRERDTAEGKRLFALVERDRVPDFRQKLGGIKVQVSGPWPATEFFALE